MRLTSLRNPGVQAALVAALLFGAGTPIAKLLVSDVSPWMLAGLLYLGSGAASARHTRRYVVSFQRARKTAKNTSAAARTATVTITSAASDSV